jgi:para-nitrobenzyl esterase
MTNPDMHSPSGLRRALAGLLLAVTAIACPAFATIDLSSDRVMSERAAIDDGSVENALVRIRQGLLQGTMLGGMRVFKGIPYAAPPVGALRWVAPQPAAGWEGIRVVTELAAQCPQQGGLSRVRESEDCLYLNIWSPQVERSAKLPVMVWLHGGGLLFGSASRPIFDGSRLADAGGVVLVTLNYRLGALGFYADEQLMMESPGAGAGNYGFLDQQAALRWVKENIAAFGGDPENVTLFGESAGATSVCVHMAAPSSQGLFHRAVVQSGLCTVDGLQMPDYIDAWAHLAEWTSCDEAENALACLRRLSADAVTSANRPPVMEYPGGLYYNHPLPVWNMERGLAIDGVFSTTSLSEAFARGLMAPVPTILGYVADEWTSFLAPERDALNEKGALDAILARKFGARAAEVKVAYASNDSAETPAQLLSRIAGDDLIVCPTLYAASALAAAGRDVFVYSLEKRLQHLEDRFLGAFHTSDLAYVFANDHWLAPLGEEDLDLSRRVMAYWTSFAQNGRPNAPMQRDWKTFSSASPNVMQFMDSSQLATGVEQLQVCDFWRTYRHLPEAGVEAGN